MSEKKTAQNNVVEAVDNVNKNDNVIHTVQKGDTVYSIAKKYLGKKSRAFEIRKANNMPTDVLRVGKKLIIPKKKRR